MVSLFFGPKRLADFVGPPEPPAPVPQAFIDEYARYPNPTDDSDLFGDAFGIFFDPIGFQISAATGIDQPQVEAAIAAAAGLTYAGGVLGAGVYDPLPPVDVGRTLPLALAGARVAASGKVDTRTLNQVWRQIAMDDWGDGTDGNGDFSDYGSGNSIPDYGPLPNFPMTIPGLGGQSMPVYTPTGAMGGAVMGAAGMAARSLWGVLRAGGGRMASFIAANGVRARMADLWPAVRKYGPAAVAAALAITGDQLVQLMQQAPTGGARRRGRGISAADIRRTRRTMRTIKRLYFMLPTRRGSSGGYRGGGGYRRRYRMPYYR